MDFNKSGKGVEKDQPQKNLIFQFFEAIKRNFWGLVKTGFFFFLAIPISGIFWIKSHFLQIVGGMNIPLNIKTERSTLYLPFYLEVSQKLSCGGIFHTK